MFILLQRFDLDLHIVKLIGAGDVLVKSEIIVQLVESFQSCIIILTSDMANRRRTGVGKYTWANQKHEARRS